MLQHVGVGSHFALRQMPLHRCVENFDDQPPLLGCAASLQRASDCMIGAASLEAQWSSTGCALGKAAQYLTLTSDALGDADWPAATEVRKRSTFELPPTSPHTRALCLTATGCGSSMLCSSGITRWSGDV